MNAFRSASWSASSASHWSRRTRRMLFISLLELRRHNSSKALWFPAFASATRAASQRDPSTKSATVLTNFSFRGGAGTEPAPCCIPAQPATEEREVGIGAAGSSTPLRRAGSTGLFLNPVEYSPAANTETKRLAISGGGLRRALLKQLLPVRFEFLRIRFRTTRKIPARGSPPDQIPGVSIEQAQNQRADLVVIDGESRFPHPAPATASDAVVHRVVLLMNGDLLHRHDRNISTGGHLDPPFRRQLLIDRCLYACVP